MMLRYRCRSLPSPSFFKPLSHHPHRPSLLNPKRCLRTTTALQAENETPDDIDQAIEEMEDVSLNSESESHNVSRQQPSTSDLFGKRSRDEEDEERGFQTYDQIDASMNIEELG